MIPNNLISAASFTPNSFQSPNAWVGHLPFAAWVIQEVSPKIFVELGTHTGNSYFSFCQSVVETGTSTKCYAVDTWQGDEHAGQYSDEIFAKVNAHHQQYYAEFSQLLRMTFDDAVAYFSDESIELLHIDGLHTYEAVRHDFETWLPKLAPGAVVMFHDTNVWERNFGVWELWEELQKRYPNNLEFVHSHGLGVLQLNNAPDGKKLAWLQSNSTEKQRLVNYFAALGSRQLERFELNELKQYAINLNQAVVERDGQIADLNQAVTDRDGQIATLNQGIAERDDLNERIVRSKSWQITKPVRWFGRVIRGEFEGAFAPFKKIMGMSGMTSKPQQSSSQVRANSSESLIISDPIKPTHPTAVIVAVYRGVEMTKRCILAAMPSVLADLDAKLLAINDASPNEGMQEMLEQLAIQWPNKFLVLKNENNLGFVGTVNRGLAYFSQYDVVLLNSDVVVPEDWLGRLIDEAYSRANVGTVTPFSNNATICSFPYFLQENAQLFDLDVNFIDAVFRGEKLPCIEAPTGVGFCMYIRRACLDKIGYLNEERFGRGYGEENDLCQRALKKGWLNLISPNMYAFHEGGVSFSSDKQALVDQAMPVIDDLHPNYHDDVRKFIQDDPVKSARAIRHIQLLATTPIPKVLHISHSVGGGVKQHIDELVEYYGQRLANILLAPHGKNGEVCISLGISTHADKLIFCLPSGYAEMVELLKAVGISAVHFHHTQGLDSKILQLPSDLGVAYLLTVHDFYWLNANPTLTDKTGKFPGYYSDSERNPLYPLPHGLTVKMWQEPLRPFVEGADWVIFPSTSTKSLFDHIYNSANTIVASHIELDRNINSPLIPLENRSVYTIGVLGALGREKGADLLEEMAVQAKSVGLPLKFKLIGYAYRPLKWVRTTGPYDPKDLKALIQTHELDVVFFSAQCPETYSYTLSYALDSGLPIVAPCIGAFPERLSGRPNTMLFDHLSPVAQILDQLHTFIQRVSKNAVVKAPVVENAKSKHDFYSHDYLRIVARDLKIIEVDKVKPFRLHLSQIKSGSQNKTPSWRETSVHILWQLHMNPYFRWISRAIPHGVKRTVRQALSSSSSHDIAQGARGKQ